MTALLPPARLEPQVEGAVYDPSAPEPELLFEAVDGRIVRKTVGAEEIRLAHLLYDWLSPAVTVEVIGPHETVESARRRVQDYFAAGVKAVWLVLPNIEQVYCYSSPTAVRVLTRADELGGDPVIPGFRLPLAELFPPPDPEPTGGDPPCAPASSI